MYKKKLLDYINKNIYSQKEKNYIVINRCLNYLDEFYKNRLFYDYIINKQIISDSFVEILDKCIADLFTALNSDVIVSDKLYSRMKIMYPEELQILGDFNNPRNLYLLSRLVLGKKYYYNNPYICKDKKTNLSNEELIYSFMFSKGTVTVSDINKYIEKMHLDKIMSYVSFFDDVSDSFIQVSESELINKDIVNINKEVLEKIKNELLFYINSFNKLESSNYVGYSSLPDIPLAWNKHLLLGLCRTYFKNDILIHYRSTKYKNLDYYLTLK